MVVVIDYRAGNLYNIAHALSHLGVPFQFSSDPETVAGAQRVILPGVGSARPAMESLRERGLVEVLRNLKVPFLGICLGMQLLFETSEEERTPCLGVLPGSVRRFDNSRVKVPHIGWNQVHQRLSHHPLFEGIPSGSYFYFVHSYYAPKEVESAAGETEYAAVFASAVAARRCWGVQFHPERSGDFGLRLLRNFMEVS